MSGLHVIGVKKLFPSILSTGLNKIVVNRLSKQFVTNDAATIIKEIEVRFILMQFTVNYSPHKLCGIINHSTFGFSKPQNDHPGVKVVILASQMQEREVGDGTNFVLLLSGFLLDEAEGLLRMVGAMLAIANCETHSFCV